MLKVAPCTVGRTVVRSYVQIFFWPDGLLLFCIIMGLSFARFELRYHNFRGNKDFKIIINLVSISCSELFRSVSVAALKFYN